jgi:hypothetical protein
MADVYFERKCRETGTVVALASPGVELNESEGWVTICVDHGGVVTHATRKLAEEWLSHPATWCPTCQEKAA